MRQLIAAAVVTAGVLSTVSPLSADVHVVTTGDIASSSEPSILIDKEIKKNDAVLFGNIINSLSEDGYFPGFVELDSIGGNVAEAETIGRMIRAHFAMTVVGNGKKCFSACVLILAAGVSRIVALDAHIGIHRPAFDPDYFADLSAQEARQKYDAMQYQVKSYLTEIGASDDLFQEMKRVGSTSVRILSNREIDALSLRGRDPAWDELINARNIKQYGPVRWRWIQQCESQVHTEKEMRDCYMRVYEVYPAAQKPLNFEDLIPAPR